MNRVCARAREMLKPFGKKTNTAKRVLRVLTVPLAACALLFGATSASADQSVPLSNHTVQTVNPTGTTVNLFDYWVVNGDNDSSKNINNDNKNDNTGINKDHQLKFNGGAGSGINKWTGRSNINGFGRLSFVKTMLVDGYPAINNGTHTSQGQGVNYTDESLAYLFNNDSQANGKQNGKAVYNNVKGFSSSRMAITFTTRMVLKVTMPYIIPRPTLLTSTIRRAYIRAAYQMQIWASSFPLTRPARFLMRRATASPLSRSLMEARTSTITLECP